MSGKLFSALRHWLAPGGAATASPRPRRVRSPSVLQMEATECGAASLAMVLGFFGKYIPLEQLRTACGVTRDGSKASNMVKAARQFGLVARGFRKEPAALRCMPLPMIIFWNFNHFVVLDGFSEDKVHLNDPGFGRRVISDAEFDQSFTGIAMTFEPGPDFIRSGRPPSLIRSLRKRLTDTRSAIFYLVAVGCALVIPGLFIPAFTAAFIDQILVGGLTGWAFPLACGMIATSIVMGALTWLQKYYLLKLETRIALTTSALFFWHVLRLPINFYSQRSAGDIGARVGINDRVARILSEDLAAAVLNVVTALFFALIMLTYDVQMTLITIGIVVINMLVLRFVSVRRKELNQRLSIDRAKVMGASMSGLMLIESLKASGSESDFFNRWAGYQARLMNSTQAMSRSSIALDIIPRFLTVTNSALVLGIGGVRVMDGVMTIGALVAFQALVASFIGPTNQLVALGGDIQRFQGDMDRLDDVMAYPCDDVAAMEDGENLAGTAKLEGTLELRNVTFGYSRFEPPLLEDFNLIVRLGARVALVGLSGCGKSTVAKLVIGLHDVWEGAVLIDGKPRADWPRRHLLNSLSAVDQDISLFSGSVRDNLTMWDTTIQQSVMINAAKDACIHDMISARPGGYDSKVEEGGGNFSGGQRQRLEIARALTSNPRLLVLDEATSALDPMTERIIDGNLRRRGCSCLVVAHRLSSIRDCDEIIFLDKGKAVERGTHAELMKLNGHYARMVANE